VATRRTATRRLRRRRLSVLLLLAVTALATLGLRQSQAAVHDGIVERWDSRTALAAGFVDTYVDQLFHAEHDVAVTNLSGSSTGAFDTVVRSFGFTNAVLLDDQGRVLQVFPAKPALIGVPIAATYPHLTAAEAGRTAVSPVVPAASGGQPIVGFALPFDTAYGRRVFSGAYAVNSSPVAAYLKAITALKGSRIYLLDDTGTVLTSSLATPTGGKLASVDPALSQASSAAASGSYGDHSFSSHRVPGTPWKVLATIPHASLFASVRGPSHYAPWLLLGILALTAALVVHLVFRRADDHDQLRVAYARLDRLASLDVLTGLLNRRSTRERLEAEHNRSRHEQGWLSVLMIDVDHFKRINDTFGHAAGDVALIEVADRLQAMLRTDDVVGRWGGEEFLVVLPDTDPEVAAVVAERLRHAVAVEAVELGTGGDLIGISISVGVASATDAIPDVLVHAADKALYAAKAAGRDRVHALTP
jgi:diguanylate cyclase (GGDEF)-like protein